MLKIFRTNQIFLSVLLIFYILLLRFSVFLAPFQWNPSGEGILSEILYGWVGSQQIASHLLAILLLLVQGVMINLLIINNRISNEVNLFPGLFYVLVSCLIPDFLYLSPVLLGNTFILFALIELFATYKNPACADKIFNSGFWTGIASLFYFPFLAGIIFLVAGLNILRAFNIRERLMMFIGFFVPYILTGLFYFLTNRFDFFWDKQIAGNLDFFSFGLTSASISFYFRIAVFVFLILFVLANTRVYFARKNIQAQKKISILYWILATAGISAMIQKDLALEHLMMLTPSLGVFLALTFSGLKHQWAESIHFLMLLGALSLQVIPWQL